MTITVLSIFSNSKSIWWYHPPLTDVKTDGQKWQCLRENSGSLAHKPVLWL